MPSMPDENEARDLEDTMLLNSSNFLTQYSGEPLRNELWELYVRGYEYFRDELRYELQVQCVEPGNAFWYTDGRITIPYDRNDRGAIFHEITHDLFHHSVFHRMYDPTNGFPPGNNSFPELHNESWGEWFCEAVRWLMETKYLRDTPWLVRDWPIQVPDRSRHKRILRMSRCSLDGFAEAWRRLVSGYDHTGDYLHRSIM